MMRRFGRGGTAVVSAMALALLLVGAPVRAESPPDPDLMAGAPAQKVAPEDVAALGGAKTSLLQAVRAVQAEAARLQDAVKQAATTQTGTPSRPDLASRVLAAHFSAAGAGAGAGTGGAYRVTVIADGLEQKYAVDAGTGAVTRLPASGDVRVDTLSASEKGEIGAILRARADLAAAIVAAQRDSAGQAIATGLQTVRGTTYYAIAVVAGGAVRFYDVDIESALPRRVG